MEAIINNKWHESTTLIAQLIGRRICDNLQMLGRYIHSAHLLWIGLPHPSFGIRHTREKYNGQ